DVVAGGAGVARRPGLAEQLDLFPRERGVRQPFAHAQAAGALRGRDVPAVGQPPGGDDAGDGPDREPRVAAADLAPALDEHDSELAVAGEARPGPRAEG